jgi:hypothetical protein
MLAKHHLILLHNYETLNSIVSSTNETLSVFDFRVAQTTGNSDWLKPNTQLTSYYKPGSSPI